MMFPIQCWVDGKYCGIAQTELDRIITALRDAARACDGIDVQQWNRPILEIDDGIPMWGNPYGGWEAIKPASPEALKIWTAAEHVVDAHAAVYMKQHMEEES